MFEYQNLIVDSLKAELQDVDDNKTLTVGLSAQLRIPETKSNGPYVVEFTYTASAEKGREPFFTLAVQVFFLGPDTASTETEAVTKPLLQEALKHLKTQLEIISEALCISSLPCPDTF